MARLLRPRIDYETKLRVLLRQLGEMWPDLVVEQAKEARCLKDLVDAKLLTLARLLSVDPERLSVLHLDHEPALGARQKVFKRGVHVGYDPDANDPDFLIYRTEVEHRLKTNVRGEHGQHPDRVLIKKMRRVERREQEKAGIRKPRRKAKIKSASRWPKGRKIMQRVK